jgi:hypothetical protein
MIVCFSSFIIYKSTTHQEKRAEFDPQQAVSRSLQEKPQRERRPTISGGGEVVGDLIYLREMQVASKKAHHVNRGLGHRKDDPHLLASIE